jgi:hypothetical protein
MMLFCGSNTRNLMEREPWAELSAAISVVEARFCDNPDFVHPTARIVRVYVWAALHNAAISWACDPRNWDRRTRPPAMPDQSTMSRRLRTPEFYEFMRQLEARRRCKDPLEPPTGQRTGSGPQVLRHRRQIERHFRPLHQLPRRSERPARLGPRLPARPPPGLGQTADQRHPNP